MNEVATKLKYYHPANIVIDPVMYAKNGCPLMKPAAIKTLIGTVIPLADVLTPNIPEAEKITGSMISSVADMEEAAKARQSEWRNAGSQRRIRDNAKSIQG